MQRRPPWKLLASALGLAMLALPLIACSDSGGTNGGDGGAADVTSDTTSGADATPDGVAGRDDEDDHCCPAGVCPLGEVCLDGSCHPAPGSNGCYVDGECADGQSCAGALQCACDGPTDCQPSAGACTWPDGCCNTDSECAPDHNCVMGNCYAAPDEASTCWVDGNCKVGEVCKDVEGCACGDAGCIPTPGHCSLPGACCLSDAECGDDGVCLGNRCSPSPAAGQCYSDADCGAGTSCAGAFVCPCGDTSCLIPTTPGVCTSAEVCCKDASDCPPTAVCVDGKSCVNPPANNKCFVDGHCGAGRVCEGAQVCACGDLCPGPDIAGTCKTLMTPCVSQGDCPGGQRCVIPDAAWCPDSGTPTQGVCVEDVDSGCWRATDCGFNKRCTAEKICLDPSGCNEPNTPGTCNVLSIEDGCCDSHLDCIDGTRCRNANTTITCPPQPTAVCLPEPQFGERCWNYLDCSDGDVCNFNFICSCGSRCKNSHMGWCGSPIGQPCKTNVDCGSGYSCAKDEECPVNPCFDGNFDCSIGGLCQPNLPGACWSQFQCGGDSYCADLQVCPANTECNEPDIPGACTPFRLLGECCDSHYACEPGLRCVSGATKTACTLDVSSVCVQRTDDKINCFSDADCDPSRTCVGAEVCLCGLEGCDSLPKPGTCELTTPP